jgi:hypothetical protein
MATSLRDGRSLRVANFFWLSRWGRCIPCTPYGVSAPAIVSLDTALNGHLSETELMRIQMCAFTTWRSHFSGCKCALNAFNAPMLSTCPRLLERFTVLVFLPAYTPQCASNVDSRFKPTRTGRNIKRNRETIFISVPSEGIRANSLRRSHLGGKQNSF